MCHFTPCKIQKEMFMDKPMPRIFAIFLILVLMQWNVIGQKSDESIIQEKTQAFFNAFHTVDTAVIDNIMLDGVMLQTVSTDTIGNTQFHAMSKSDFLKAFSRSNPGDLTESIENISISVSDGLAVAIMDYQFYFRSRMIHCGKDVITWVKIEDEWYISALADTRTIDCAASAIAQIDQVLDDWHLAAAVADSTTYFDAMTDNSYFIGTDSSEVWTKDEFLTFAAPYFAKGKAWDFKKIKRNIHKIENHTAWFDETLDTWMGVCRGSGVLKAENGHWKIAHYVLSVTVPNEKIKEFLKVMGE